MIAYFVFILISFLASAAGNICGIGGGVIIKPVLDAFHMYSVSTISFISGCVVLAMSAYSVSKAVINHELEVDKGKTTFLAIGAAVGGVLGKIIFQQIKLSFENPERVGTVQSCALLALTLLTILYKVNEDKIRTRYVNSRVVSVIIGLALGMMSSFLGIGGGPINLVILSFFFSMGTKAAAQNSLYIILISQFANLVYSLLKGQIPDVPILLLAAMVLCGILGAGLGRKINKRLDDEGVKKLFIGLLSVISIICIYNIFTIAS